MIQRVTVRSELFGCHCSLTLSPEQIADLEPQSQKEESFVQLFEDRRYWYQVRADCEYVVASLVSDGKLIRESPHHHSEGIIDTKSQAGMLALNVRLSRGSLEETLTLPIEVLPAKFDLTSFRLMVEDICGYMLDLALRLSAITRLPLHVRDRVEPSGVQQRFFFLQDLLRREPFRRALAEIAQMPHSTVKQELSQQSIIASRRLGKSAIRTIGSGANRIPIPATHPLAHIKTLPRHSLLVSRRETLDTPENRFVKFVLEEFERHLASIRSVCESSNSATNLRIVEDIATLQRELRQVLGHSLFKEVGTSSILPLGSPVLQRRSGYREVLEAWLRFHVAASLAWEGGEDVFGAGKKDTDKLYEYWLFFQLLKVLCTDLGLPIPPADALLKESENGLSFRLKAGRSFLHEGVIPINGKQLNVRFSYNRAFLFRSGLEPDGSWSYSMRPDFTISFWPACLSEERAASLDLLLHLHFDSKYRLRTSRDLFGVDNELESVKEDEKKGNYKRADIMIAHAYRDAIRRSGGAYIIYPGEEGTETLREQYHEVLPGLGAFPVRPVAIGNTGIEKIGQFLRRVAIHISDPRSARNQASSSTWVAYSRYMGDWTRENVLVGATEECFPEEWIRQYSVYPLRVSDRNDVPHEARPLDAITSVMLILRDGKALLLKIARGVEARWLGNSQITTEYGQVPDGIYAMLPLALESQVELSPRRADSLQRLKSLARDYLGGLVPKEIVLDYVLEGSS